MLTWLSQNLATIIISLIILLIVVAVIVKSVKDKKKGKSITCGNNCAHCAMVGSCHSQTQAK